MIDFRCKWCNRLLSKVSIKSGRIEIKCPNKECKRNKDKGINSYTFGEGEPIELPNGDTLLPLREELSMKDNKSVDEFKGIKYNA